MSSYEVHVLATGYSKTVEDGNTEANCTCTLIKGSKNIIVDTMTAWDSNLIKDGLEKNNVKPENISYVVCTHGHSDHIGNNNLFLNAVHIVGFDISHKDVYYSHNFQDGHSYDLDGEYVKVIPTIGHTLADVSVIVKTKNNETVAITGDLFESEDDLEDDSIWKIVGSMDPIRQKYNRNRIISMVDWIVPGHGPKFRVTEGMKHNSTRTD